VVGETPLLLEVEDKRPDFMLSDLGYIHSCSAGSEKILKVTHAVIDNVDGIVAFVFGDRAELVTIK
jgi:uncharacterized protein with von Willebrand factor type A (vWA) domain